MSAECTYLHCDWYLDPFDDVHVCRTCGQSRAIDELPLPAQPASTLDTSPPSRTSNAASANGAASLLLKLQHAMNSSDAYGDELLVTIFRTDAEGIKSHLEQRAADELNRLGAKIKDGMQRLKEEAEALVLEPMPEPAIRAAVYGCTDAQCVCGRCPPIKIAVDCSIERVLKS